MLSLTFFVSEKEQVSRVVLLLKSGQNGHFAPMLDCDPHVGHPFDLKTVQYIIERINAMQFEQC